MADPDPHIAIVETPTTAGDFARQVYQNPKSVNLAWFLQLNQLSETSPLTPGSILVVPGAQATACTVAEMQLAATLRETGSQRSVRPGLIDHPETTNRFHDLLGYTQASQAAGGLGAFSFMLRRQIDEITTILRELQKLYQRTYNAQGNLKGAPFFQRRRALLHRLDDALRFWMRRGLIGPSERRLRQALGLKSSRIVHRWKQAGTSAGGVPELRRRIDGLNGAVWKAKAVGYVGIALDVAWSAAEIDRHLDENRPDRNRRVAGEVGRLGGSVLGGLSGGALGGSVGYSACSLVFSVPSGGTSLLWCGIIAGGVGALGLGYVGGHFISKFSKQIYDLSEPLVGR